MAVFNPILKDIYVFFEVYKGFYKYVDMYTKNRIIKGLSSVIGLKEFYNPEVFTSLDQKTNELDNALFEEATVMDKIHGF